MAVNISKAKYIVKFQNTWRKFDSINDCNLTSVLSFLDSGQNFRKVSKKLDYTPKLYFAV
jgi:hypothetical protein